MSRRLGDRPGTLVLDSAHGTRLIERGLSLATSDPALWVLDRAEAVAELHQADVAAGSDAVLTCTFGANRWRLGQFERAGEVTAVNARGVALARQSGASLVFGSIGPSMALSGSADPVQVEALLEAGVDALYLQTFDAESARAATDAVVKLAGNVPVVVSLWNWGKPDSRELADLGAFAVGINCVPLERAVAWVAAGSGMGDVPRFVQPSGQVPGSPATSPDEFEIAARFFVDSGVRAIGGCCGTTPEHVRFVRRAVPYATGSW